MMKTAKMNTMMTMHDDDVTMTRMKMHDDEGDDDGEVDDDDGDA